MEHQTDNLQMIQDFKKFFYYTSNVSVMFELILIGEKVTSGHSIRDQIIGRARVDSGRPVRLLGNCGQNSYERYVH